MNPNIDRKKLILIGCIGKPFGFKGYSTFIFYISEILKIMSEINIFYLEESEKLEILEFRQHGKDKLVIKIKDSETEEDAKKFVNKKLFVEREFIKYNLIPEDLLHLNVYNEKNEFIGSVIDFGEFGNGVLISIQSKDSGIIIMKEFTEENFPDECIFEADKVLIKNISKEDFL